MGPINHPSKELWAANSNVSAVRMLPVRYVPVHASSLAASHGGCSAQLRADEEGNTPRIQPKVGQGLSRWTGWLVLPCMADALVRWWAVVEQSDLGRADGCGRLAGSSWAWYRYPASAKQSAQAWEAAEHWLALCEWFVCV